MDATHPCPPRDDRDDDDEKVAPSTGGALRCPYCHDALTGGLAGDCVRCGTRHHLSCFADHHGCSTHGCGSTRATTAGPETRVTSFSPLTCAHCAVALAADAMVAHCTGCGDVMHVDCYEQQRSCKSGARCCSGALEVMPHVEVAAALLVRLARGLVITGVVLAGVLVTLALLAPLPGVVGLLFGGLAAAVTTAGIGVRWRARRLLERPRAVPPPPKT